MSETSPYTETPEARPWRPQLGRRSLILSSMAIISAGLYLNWDWVTAIDISRESLMIAASNAERHGVSDRVAFLESNVFSAVPPGQFDLIVSNPPYIRDDELDGLDADVRDHEPVGALVGGVDGLDVVRRIVSDAPDHLKDNGHLMLEIDGQQAEAVAQLLDDTGYRNVGIEKDLSGIQRVVFAEK